VAASLTIALDNVDEALEADVAAAVAELADAVALLEELVA
jgi:hypothetical protein|tara:strand:+ start:438 stop:557 length:120 start_codon:yes stop_codon:yes gene_type:complete